MKFRSVHAYYIFDREHSHLIKFNHFAPPQNRDIRRLYNFSKVHAWAFFFQKIIFCTFVYFIVILLFLRAERNIFTCCRNIKSTVVVTTRNSLAERNVAKLCRAESIIFHFGASLHDRLSRLATRARRCFSALTVKIIGQFLVVTSPISRETRAYLKKNFPRGSLCSREIQPRFRRDKTVGKEGRSQAGYVNILTNDEGREKHRNYTPKDNWIDREVKSPRERVLQYLTIRKLARAGTVLKRKLLRERM